MASAAQRLGRTRTGMLLILMAALLWGTSGATGRYLSQAHALSPLAISFYRLAIGGLALVAASRRSLTPVGSITHTGVLALIGVGMALYQASFFVAVSLAGVSLSTLVALGLAPVLVAAASAVVSRQAPDGRVLLSLVGAVVGLSLLVGSPTTAAGQAGAGAALATLSAAGFAGVTLLGRWLGSQVAPLRTATWGFGIGAALLLPLVLAEGLPVPVTPLAIGLLLYLGIGPTALAYAAFFHGVRWVVPSASSILTLVEPLLATVIASVLFQERLSLVGVIGATAMLLAMLNLYLLPPGHAADRQLDQSVQRRPGLAGD